ncbi:MULTISPECIES: DUF763 domain-containing protein [Dictyoglomus]|uniref:DUF763 domain-containing protein n=1 Tax=Dictyoglomus turgidum (strain DSM 6724 / Z-1310) TaxID=515635 RepID=B8DZX1_DICTD|nr:MULTISPECIES: DUF763 domain-containing protein [Dictyoglomus]ACK42054.1 protein of unknown function DUF763 [Dictyoglomus turgidum DSM 6724]HBU31385.1 DUF763 domain-containing protein [Dictyoglomus sp.]
MFKREIAELPLHSGKAPAWLFQRMKKLAREIILIFAIENRTDEFLRKLSDPFWFQALGCILGFDWHSSGLTTTTGAALKEGLGELSHEIGLYIVGGKGKTALNTPEEITKLAEKEGFDPQKWIFISRIVARVDNNAIQDGYQLYHHLLIFTKKGTWCVIQQGMNNKNNFARRYHWLGEELKSFTEEPHKGIITQKFEDYVVNLVAKESKQTQEIITTLMKEDPNKVISLWNKVSLKLPSYHPITPKEIKSENLKKILLKTYEAPPKDFQEVLLKEGVGAKTLRALTLISELVYDAPASIKDPARFSFAHGGKDGHPYPVDKKNYDKTIEILERAIKNAKLGRREELETLKRLSFYFRI